MKFLELCGSQLIEIILSYIGTVFFYYLFIFNQLYVPSINVIYICTY